MSAHCIWYLFIYACQHAYASPECSKQSSLAFANPYPSERCLPRPSVRSASSYRAGDPVPVQWDYEGTGENFLIHLLKGGQPLDNGDLCAAEAGGVCFDLTQDQTVLLPETG